MWICKLAQFILAVHIEAFRAIRADLALNDVSAPLSLPLVLLVGMRCAIDLRRSLLSTAKVLLMAMVVVQRRKMLCRHNGSFVVLVMYHK